MDDRAERVERITAGDIVLLHPAVAGLQLRAFVSGASGAHGFSTGMATFRPGAELAPHTHDCSEAVTVLDGEATVVVEDREYRLGALDCIHVPSGVTHSVSNRGAVDLPVHSAFGSVNPQRFFVEHRSSIERGPARNSQPGDPETVRRFAQCEKYELSPGALFTDLFARRFGSKGICGGYGGFLPGASLPCHTHAFDESITIVTGRATCLVKGSAYELSGCETAFVPRHRPHRFLNNTGSLMAMIWVYAGDEPDRTVVSSAYCSGALAWPGKSD